MFVQIQTKTINALALLEGTHAANLTDKVAVTKSKHCTKLGWLPTNDFQFIYFYSELRSNAGTEELLLHEQLSARVLKVMSSSNGRYVTNYVTWFID